MADYRSNRAGVFVATISFMLALLPVAGCKSDKEKADSVQKMETASSGASATAAVNVSAAGPFVDLNCTISRMQKPPEAFHYSFQDQSDNPWTEDAEVTPQNISGSFSNKSLPSPQQFQGVPQDVWSNLTAIGRMASLFSTIRNTAAVANQGQAQKNGYATTAYAIDTANGTATEQGLFKDVLGPGGFEKGSVWVTSDGCPVQMTMDEELHDNKGAVIGKAHYEEAMVKK